LDQRIKQRRHHLKSLLAWERGLKLHGYRFLRCIVSRSLRGSVD
jgi:hypothetical protein